jgi:NAD(P)-dependent dehydrogenase (short-subunit alcohol dehydrogenase family)
MVEAVVEKHGRLDILVSAAAAGLAGPAGAAGAASLPDEEFSRASLLALNGSFYCAKYAAERMAAHGAGCIVTVTAASWGAASAGAARLTAEMAGDLGPRGLRLAAIAAGPRATPVDVAHAALFLASDMASRVNGAVLAVGA